MLSRVTLMPIVRTVQDVKVAVERVRSARHKVALRGFLFCKLDGITSGMFANV